MAGRVWVAMGRKFWPKADAEPLFQVRNEDRYEQRANDAAYIAAMHPPVGSALAAALRDIDERHPRLTDPDGDVMCQGCIERGAHVFTWPCDELEPALAVARLIVGAP
jgi:hypothetical protein